MTGKGATISRAGRNSSLQESRVLDVLERLFFPSRVILKMVKPRHISLTHSRMIVLGLLFAFP